jgi:gas vesicle protein
MKKVINSALKTALYLLELSDQASDNVRDRVADRFQDVKGQARDSYGVVSERVNNAARALRGDDGNAARSVLMFVGGVSAGVALGLIFAPASGEETRRAIAQRFEDLGSKARDSSAA